MATATLTVDLDALGANWRALDRLSGPGVQTAAVVKADAYGLGVTRVARTLAARGARRFFVAWPRKGPGSARPLAGAADLVFSGHMPGDTEMMHDLDLTPMLNSLDQITRHLEALPGHPFGVQLDTGMNRLGVEPRMGGGGADPARGGPAAPDEPPRLRGRAGPPDERAQLAVSADDRRHRPAPQPSRQPAASCWARWHFDLTRPASAFTAACHSRGPAGRHACPCR